MASSAAFRSSGVFCRESTLKHCHTRGSTIIPRRFQSSKTSPRHLLSIADLTPDELVHLVRRSAALKTAFKSGNAHSAVQQSLLGQTIAMTFSKRSTRTRVSTEAAIAKMGGHPLFLGRDDIQLGVNETLQDTSVVISSMVSGWVARVNEHAEVAGIAQFSSVPVINALSDTAHPLQTLADVLTMSETFGANLSGSSGSGLGLEGRKIAWIGDANNVLYDLAIGAAKLDMKLAVATPVGYSIPTVTQDLITDSAVRSEWARDSFTVTRDPQEAVKDADIIVTDTWVSMGQEGEMKERLQAFTGFRVTHDLVKKGGARPDWRFMHCLPRHPEEVEDDVFYSPNSLVFPEAENRLWTVLAALEAFVVQKGRFLGV